MNRQVGAALPAGPAALFGREHDLRRLTELLQGGSWLITLRGPGGIGKTALALHLAHQVQSRYEQVQFVDLSAIRDPNEVLGVIAATLPTQAHGSEPAQLIRNFAVQQRTLLILDNFERLLPAAVHLSELHTGGDGLQIVVTSRALLHLHDEHEYPVEPLALPESALHAASSPAVQLFVRRVQVSAPTFELGAHNTPEVVRLCGILEGVPLALELAAARLRTTALPELLAQLERSLTGLRANFRDRPERLHSLRAAVQWSYDLLSEDERRLIECCAVFEGGFSSEALVEVWGSEDAPDGIESLFDQSLVQRLDAPDTRWKMLQPLREVAVEHLDHSSEAPTWRERHARYFLKMIEDLGAYMDQDDAQDPRGSYLPHYPNIRAGLVWAITQQQADLAYRYLAAIGDLWLPFNLYVQEAPLVNRALALPRPADREVLLFALFTGGDSLGAAGERQAAAALHREVVTLCHELGKLDLAAVFQLDLIDSDLAAGRGTLAWDELQQTMRAYRERTGDTHQTRWGRLFWARSHLLGAECLLELGHLEQGLAYATLARQYFREMGDLLFGLYAEASIGKLLLHLGRTSEARAVFLACLQESANHNFSDAAIAVCDNLTQLAAGVQDWSALVQLTAFAKGDAWEPSRSGADYRLRRDLDQAREALGEVGFQAAWTAGKRLLLPDAVALAKRLCQAPTPELSHPDLTPREREVLALVAQGHPDRRIARLLGISPATASKHVGHLLRKLGLRNRVELARWALAQPAESSSVQA